MAGRKLARTSQTPVWACCRYVVKPITGRAGPTRELGNVKVPDAPTFPGLLRSPAFAWALLPLELEPLKTAHPFPVGHCAVERSQLDARIVQIMLDDIVAEGLMRHLGLAEQRRRFRQGGRQPFRPAGIGVALQRFRQFQLPLDAVQPARDQRRNAEVLVDVTAGRTAFHPHAVPVPYDAQRAGAVVHPPRDRRRGEAALDKTLVGVDVRRIEQRQLPQRRQLARDEAAEYRRHPEVVVRVGEHRAAVVTTQRDVDMAAVSFALIELRHERQALAVLVGDLLGAVLVDGVVVAGEPRVVVAERDLLLTEVALALDTLAVHARAVHTAPDVA